MHEMKVAKKLYDSNLVFCALLPSNAKEEQESLKSDCILNKRDAGTDLYRSVEMTNAANAHIAEGRICTFP